MPRRLGRFMLVSAVLAVTGSVAAQAAEPSRGFPYRASPLECVRLDSLPRAVRVRDLRILDALARRGGSNRDERCSVRRVTRYGGNPPVATWNVQLSCAGSGPVAETWTQNGDGSVTIDRDGGKTTVRACER